MSLEDFKKLADADKNIEVTEDTIVNGTGTSIGGDESNNALTGYHINVGDNVKLDLNNLAGNHMDIDGNGIISIKLDHDAGANGAAVYINGNITANKLSIDTTNAPNTKGVYTYGGDVNFNVNELDIKSNSHGIFTTGDATSNVNIYEAQSVNIETNGAHGIVNSGNTNHVNNIYIKSDKENSEVKIFSHTAGISNNNSGGGVIEIKADTINIGTDNLYAVRGDHGDITLSAKNNIVSGGTSGVHTKNGHLTLNASEDNEISTVKVSNDLGAIFSSVGGNGIIDILAARNNIITAVTDGIRSEGAGKITVKAEKGTNQIISDRTAVYNNGTGDILIQAGNTNYFSISPFATYENLNNILVGLSDSGKDSGNGIKSDSTEDTTVIAQNDNIIMGTHNGILSSDSGTINVIAGNDNIIGKYYDTEGNNFISQKGINATAGNVYINAQNGSVQIYGTTHGIYADNPDNVKINVKAKKIIEIKSSYYGIYVYGKNNSLSEDKITLDSSGGSNIILVEASNSSGYGIYAAYADQISLVAKDNNIVTLDGRGPGIRAIGSNVNLESKNGLNKVSANWNDNTSVGLQAENAGKITLNAAVRNEILGGYAGILSQSPYSDAETNVTLTANSNKVSAKGVGVQACSGGNVYITANDGDNIVTGLDETNSLEIGLSTEINNPIGQSKGLIAFVAKKGSNKINTYDVGIDSKSKGIVSLNAYDSNIILANDSSKKYIYEGTGNSFAIYSQGASSVSLEAGNHNQLFGAVYAEDVDTTVTLSGLDDKASKSNVIRSYAKISNAGDLSSDTTGTFENKSVVSALYAEQGAKIELKGEVNDIGTYADYEDEDTLERTVWAYNGYADDYSGERVGSEITINGNVQIKTDSYDKSPKSLDVAIAAGTGVSLTPEKVSKALEDDERAQVNITYSNVSNGWSDTGMAYDVEGDILSAYEGLVKVQAANDNAGINIHGNLLAGNNGILTVDLGKNGVLTGRVDDYGDAGYVGDEGHSKEESFSDPAFSSNIYKGGVVNLAMGEGSRWNVTGQSWITRIKASDSAISATSPRIDLITANTDRSTDASALTVYELKGNAVFNMSLDGNRNVSDMLYIKNAQGEYMVNVKDAVTVADMYANGHTGLRFATLGAGSSANFRAITWDNGVNNVEYEIDTDDYDTSTENTAYNGSELTAGKPGDTTVDTFFSSDGEPGSTTTGSGDENIDTQNLAAKTMTAKVASENAGIETAAASDTPNTDATNYKLVAVKSSETSDAGKTVINMSRANYANAVYMDTLNKRQGEARFVSDTDHGVWVRLRHDNIGKEDAFRSHNTMVEVGIDQRDVHDYGEFHTGVALDYMNGSLDYHTVDGDGDIERYGIWFYTTYLGNDGQYADLILKYGHLKNDFGFNTKTQGEHVTGDYTNETASISAEYGWKFSNSHNYYIEPQAQLQYTYITGADYTTSQGSRVDLDSIHSLIGRVGFRAGKDFLDWEHPASFYLRADALHEFLGDQDIRAYDNTGVMDITYENDDTWYTVGLGMTVKSSDNTYFFIEGETALGADNEDTYTVSGGFRHSF